MIDKVSVQGKVETDLGLIKKVIVEHFKGLYSKRAPAQFAINDLGLARLALDKSKELVKEVTLEEIKEAFLSCDPTKALGYNGFNLKCLKHVWPIVGEEFGRCILNFFEEGKLPAGINITWVSLVPKRKEALHIMDFRPISLIGSIYKVIAKVMSRRLKGVMPELIGEAQTAFVRGRQILDGALIANEVVNWLKKHKKDGVLLKLDFQKAYDTIDWDSLDLVLKEMGFTDKWRGWVRECVTTAKMSILVNGTPCKPFKMERGLRQGDPLSTFLFVLMAEVLNRLLIKAEALGFFQGLKVGTGQVKITHLQFADDTLIFCDPRLEFLANIKRLLYSFQRFFWSHCQLCKIWANCVRQRWKLGGKGSSRTSM